MRRLNFSGPLSLCAAAVLTGRAWAAAPDSAAPVKTNLVTPKPVCLATKTPLGEASITLPAGSLVTNCEILGEDLLIHQGPFTASLKLSELQTNAPAEATNSPTPPALSAGQAKPEPQEFSTPAAAPSPAENATPERTPATPGIETTRSTPDWVLPAAGGALAAYALFTTLVLFRSRRRPRRGPALQKKEDPTKTPVVALPPNQKNFAKPAVMAEDGRAVACPLCAKNIPVEKIGKGRNECPLCGGKFVVE